MPAKRVLSREGAVAAGSLGPTRVQGGAVCVCVVAGGGVSAWLEIDARRHG